MTLKLQREIYEPFIFASSPVFDAVMSLLTEWIGDESSLAFRQEHAPETRAHACGRAAALSDLKTELLERRATAEAIRLRG